MTQRAILFDFDGTLAPNLDLPDMRRQVIELTRSYQVPDTVWEGQYIVEIIEAAATHLGTRQPDTATQYHDQAHSLITRFELEAAATTEPFPGVRVLLTELRSAGVKLGVVTRNCRAAVLATFPDLLDFVDQLSARGDCRFLKPDPRHARYCLDQLGVEPQRASMIGDGQLDMRLGRDLQMYCVGVLSGSSDSDGLRQHGAHHIVPQLSADTELTRLLAI